MKNCEAAKVGDLPRRESPAYDDSRKYDFEARRYLVDIFIGVEQSRGILIALQTLATTDKRGIPRSITALPDMEHIVAGYFHGYRLRMSALRDGLVRNVVVEDVLIYRRD